MGKRGPKPSSPNGEPKKRVSMALASDVLTWMRSHKPMVPWLESLMRDAMRAEEFRNFGSALPFGDNDVLGNAATARRRETSNILHQWITPRHADHFKSTMLVPAILEPGVERYRCAQCTETLTLTYDVRDEDGIMTFTITPTVSFE